MDKGLSQARLLEINEEILQALDEATKTRDYDTASARIARLLSDAGLRGYRDLISRISDKAEEKLLVLNEDGSSTGKYAERGYVHKNNLWHREVGCLPLRCFVDNAGKKKLMVLLEKRSPAKKQHGGCWALVAGHVVGDTSLLDAVCAEASEEMRSLYYKDDFLQITKPTKNVRENENYAYATAFVVSDRLVKDQFMYQPEEVSGLAWFSIDEFEAMIARENPKECIFRNNEYYKSIVNALKSIEKVSLWDEFLGTHIFTPLQSAIGLGGEKDKDEQGGKQA